MDAAQIHLMLNHSPLILTISGVLLLIYAQISKHLIVFRIGCIFVVAAAIMIVPTFLSGEGTSRIIRGLPGVGRPYIREHAEAADMTLYIMVAFGLLALIALFVTRNALAYNHFFSIVLILVGIFVGTVVARTAHLGGEIHHPELRSDSLQTSPMPARDSIPK